MRSTHTGRFVGWRRKATDCQRLHVSNWQVTEGQHGAYNLGFPHLVGAADELPHCGVLQPAARGRPALPLPVAALSDLSPSPWCAVPGA
jgi:hypothetical protein